MTTQRLHPSIVLSAYLEPLVRGRRVAILGDATAGLAEELAERGARLVHVYDPDAARVAEAIAKAGSDAKAGVLFAVYAGDFGVRDGAFEVVVAADLTLFADPADTMRRARRLIPANGLAVLGVPNADRKRSLIGASASSAESASPGARPIGYYELYDLVSLQFARVRMVGQVPFVGYTVADFAPTGEPDVKIDTSLVSTSDEPEHFLALASDRPVTVDGYTVVALPWRDVAEEREQRDNDTPRAPDPALVAEVASSVERARELTAELEKVRAAVAEGTEALGVANARADELGAEAALRAGKLKETEARAGDNHVRAERLANQIRDLEEELVRQRDRGTKLSRQLDEEKRGRQKAELELGMVRTKPEIAGAKDRIDALAAELEAGRARVTELEAEKVETQRRPEPSADAKLAQRIVELQTALDDALREAARAAEERETEVRRATSAEGALKAERATAGVAAAEASARVALLERRIAASESAVTEIARDRDVARVEARDAKDLRQTKEAAAVELQRELDTARRELDTVKRAREAAEARATQAAETARGLTAAQAEVASARSELTTVRAQLASAGAELASEKARAETLAQASVSDEATAELQALEAALVDRGRVITALRRELVESERVGRELLAELSEGASNGNGSADDLRDRLDALAAGAARTEADLQAASWKIRKLERELADAQRSPEGEPSSIQVELEQALAAARDEVATLRRELGSRN